MPKRLQVLKAWILNTRVACMAAARRRDNLILFGSVFAALTVMLAVTTVFLLKPARYSEADLAKNQVSVADNTFRHPLTGVVIEAPLGQLPQVYGVMVENSADAWPLSGIEDAFLVIEAPVEGNIPRLEAFFVADMDVDKIGPVRSARPYYLDWNDELDGLYAHVGGSPDALNFIDEYATLDLNEFFQGEYFWRDTVNRGAPHNVYTSTELLDESLDELKLEPAEYDSWQFKVDAPLDVDPLSLKIDWGQEDVYDVKWAYQADSNQYLRLQGTEIMNTAFGDSVLANNVVVMATSITVIDSAGRRRITTVGEGDALVVQDGKIILGRWKKPERTERLRIYDAEGKEIKMNAGKTWIEVVPSLEGIQLVTNWQ